MVTLRVKERRGIPRTNEPVRVGIPLKRGLAHEACEMVVVDEKRRKIPYQLRVLALWPDRSIKWLLLDALVSAEANGCAALFLRRKTSLTDELSDSCYPTIKFMESGTRLIVDTGVGRFVIARDSVGPLAAVAVGGSEILAPVGSRIRLRTSDSEEYLPTVDCIEVEESGPVRATILVEGGFGHEGQRTPLMFRSRLIFFANSNFLRMEFQIRNPQAACHPGGMWDLGDSGSFSFKDLSILLYPRNAFQNIQWCAEDCDHTERVDDLFFTLYQDSSGGENWDSPNHVDFAGRRTVSFSGYQVKAGLPDQWKLVGEGRRATPWVLASTEEGWIAATTRNFWQNFPKALRRENGELSIGLFPMECPSGFELQGGEQKRHVIFFDFGVEERESVITLMADPLEVSVDPVCIEESEAIPWFSGVDQDDNSYLQYINNVIEGPNSFFEKRESVDEYGWRNFGDLYADHEAVHHGGREPMVSHYNNQYDFIYGALIHFLRTGDSRWRHLLEDAACHTIDVDIYHTNSDRAAYNGGLFWHTDHYKDAATCSHRGYSRRNGGAGYGGGPSNEHNYTSGLLHYYYLFGDPEGAAAVLELADWVIAMDDGSRSLFGVIDAGPTGFASQTTDRAYHGPGRGAGNSINALLDAYRLVGKREYMSKTEELIQRCIHPTDDIRELRLDEPEYRWSYLVFLQMLGKFLHLKEEFGETDYFFHYARESLLHYANWIVENEIPYKEALHKVLIPTETWPAHDIRKSHILYVAARYAEYDKKERLRQRAQIFFERCLQDVLDFKTAYLTRPLVILCVYGYVPSYFERHNDTVGGEWRHNYSFGNPRLFLPQRLRIKSELRRKLAVLGIELWRLWFDKLGRVKNEISRFR